MQDDLRDLSDKLEAQLGVVQGKALHTHALEEQLAALNTALEVPVFDRETERGCGPNPNVSLGPRLRGEACS